MTAYVWRDPARLAREQRRQGPPFAMRPLEPERWQRMTRAQREGRRVAWLRAISDLAATQSPEAHLAVLKDAVDDRRAQALAKGRR